MGAQAGRPCDPGPRRGRDPRRDDVEGAGAQACVRRDHPLGRRLRVLSGAPERSALATKLPTMTLTTEECLAAITEHSAGFASACRDNLSAHVAHCPDWSVADLVWHLSEVHWFWATIAEERLDTPPEEHRRPERPADEALLDTFEAGAAPPGGGLRGAGQAPPPWARGPPQQQDAVFSPPPGPEAAGPPPGGAAPGPRAAAPQPPRG